METDGPYRAWPAGERVLPLKPALEVSRRGSGGGAGWHSESGSRKAVEEIENVTNPRLRAFREKLMDLTITAEYLPGKRNEAADALSRIPMWRESGVEDPSENIFSVSRAFYRKWHGVKVRSVTKTGEKSSGKRSQKLIPPHSTTPARTSS